MSNALDRNLTKGEVVKVDGREFICDSGFGMSSFTNGTKVFGKWKDTQENGVINGYSIDK